MGPVLDLGIDLGGGIHPVCGKPNSSVHLPSHSHLRNSDFPRPHLGFLGRSSSSLDTWMDDVAAHVHPMYSMRIPIPVPLPLNRMKGTRSILQPQRDPRPMNPRVEMMSVLLIRRDGEENRDVLALQPRAERQQLQRYALCSSYAASLARPQPLLPNRSRSSADQDSETFASQRWRFQETAWRQRVYIGSGFGPARILNLNLPCHASSCAPEIQEAENALCLLRKDVRTCVGLGIAARLASLRVRG